jgi:tetratricopeptide (TPR) repeat protein
MNSTRRFILLLIIPLLLLYSRAFAGDSPRNVSNASELLAQGEYGKAIDDLKREFSLYPYDITLRRNLATAYVQLGQRELKATRYNEAADHFAEAHDLFPDNKELRLMRGMALYMAKKYDVARAELEQAGDAADALFLLGRISYDTGDLPTAIAYWKRAQEKNPGEKGISTLIEKAERELPVESRMDKGYSSMFDLTFDAELPPGLSSEVLDALEKAYNTVCADLNFFPGTRVPVLLYTKRDYSSVTQSPDWSGGLYDGKIRLPVGGISSLTPQLRAVVFHEFTHVVIAQMTGGNIPTWLNEGLAEIEGRKEFNHPVSDLDKAASQNQMLSLDRLSGSFLSMPGTEASIAYEQSYSLANFMVTRYGWYAVQGILKNLAARSDVKTAVAKALSNYSLDLQGVMDEWRTSLSQ